jgi:hypothetical protein
LSVLHRVNELPNRIASARHIHDKFSGNPASADDNFARQCHIRDKFGGNLALQWHTHDRFSGNFIMRLTIFCGFLCKSKKRRVTSAIASGQSDSLVRWQPWMGFIVVYFRPAFVAAD